ncbi:MAG: alpha-L-fucosidase, partial [Bryobacteraceae bacterium]
MEKYFSRRDFLKRTSIAGAGVAMLSNGAGAAFGKTPPFAGKFQVSADSLSLYNVPTWYRDAKFGIFIHWGVFSVPAHKSEWYPHYMYDRKSPVFDWHRQHWGPQSMFGYKDFIPLFRAEKWQPAEWVNLFKTAGAKYIVPVGEHHDGFPMYDSHLTRWTARKMGPHRDVVGELAREIRNENLKLGISSHRGNNWFYFTFEPDFDDSN